MVLLIELGGITLDGEVAMQLSDLAPCVPSSVRAPLRDSCFASVAGL